MPPSGTFQGFHREAVDFFRQLGQDNSKTFWDAHRATYEEHVRTPMRELEHMLEGLFGSGHIYRPNRDVRFSKDKRPYKEHVAVSFGGRGPRAVAGRHVHFDPDGMWLASGVYRLEGDGLAAYRRAVADERAGTRLVAIVAELADKGYEIHGEELKRAPSGFAADHPRVALLRHKGLAAVRRWPLEPWMFTPEAGDRILQVFADGEGLVVWLRDHVA